MSDAPESKTSVVIHHYVTQPFWRCIYCGETDALSKEHAIPHGLLGRIVLPKASCEACRVQTHAFETHCMENLFGGAFRQRIGIPPRRGRMRASKHITHFAMPNGQPMKISLDTPDVPISISMPALKPPKILLDNPTDDIGLVWHRAYTRDMATIGERFGATGITKTFSPAAFLLLVAKIGHCLAHTILTPAQIATWTLFTSHQMFRFDLTQLLYFVGGVKPDPENETTNLMHDVGLYELEQEHRELLCAKVRLFAFMGAPENIVVVGERSKANLVGQSS